MVIFNSYFDITRGYLLSVFLYFFSPVQRNLARHFFHISHFGTTRTVHQPSYRRTVSDMVNFITSSLRPSPGIIVYVREIIPKWPYFRLVNYYNSPRDMVVCFSSLNLGRPIHLNSIFVRRLDK